MAGADGIGTDGGLEGKQRADVAREARLIHIFTESGSRAANPLKDRDAKSQQETE